jgi:hypothetical protein
MKSISAIALAALVVYQPTTIIGLIALLPISIGLNEVKDYIPSIKVGV